MEEGRKGLGDWEPVEEFSWVVNFHLGGVGSVWDGVMAGGFVVGTTRRVTSDEVRARLQSLSYLISSIPPDIRVPEIYSRLSV